MRLNKLILLISLLSFTACVSKPQKFETGQPVELGSYWNSRGLTQKGEPVYAGGFINEVWNEPAILDHVENSAVLAQFAGISSGVGAVFVITSLGESNRDSEIWAGVGLMGLGIGLGYFSNQQMGKAVSLYNKSLGLKAERAFVSPVKDGAVAGLNVSF